MIRTIIAFLFSCSIASAGVGIGVIPFPGPGGVGSVAADECTGKLVCQNLEGTGYDHSETWTEYTESGGSVNPNYTTTILRGNESLFLDPGTGEALAYTSFTANSSVYYFFRIRITSFQASSPKWFGTLRSGSTMCAAFSVDDDGRVILRHGSNEVYSSLYLSLNTTYYVWGYHSAAPGTNNGTAWLRVGTSSTMPETDTVSTSAGVSATTVDRIQFGTGYNSTDEIIVDQVYVSTSAIGSVAE